MRDNNPMIRSLLYILHTICEHIKQQAAALIHFQNWSISHLHFALLRIIKLIPVFDQKDCISSTACKTVHYISNHM